jgi:phosphopantetheinyl transferase
MPLFLTHTDPLWGVWKIEESPDTLLSRLSGTDAGFVASLEKLHTVQRRQEWLAVRVLLKELTGEETRIAYRPGGAPYLPGKDWHISISHTPGYAAVILSKHSPTGIDIEYRSNRILKVRSRFLNPEEDRYIDPEHEVDHLLVCWCAKEAVFKQMGQSGLDFREHLHIAAFPYSESGSLIVSETRTAQAASYRLNYLINRYFAIGWFLDMMVVS